MSTRDPLSRLPTHAAAAGDGGREPTQSLNLEPGELPGSLALGTHQVTSIESPFARGKTHTPPAVPPRARSRGDASPDEYIGAVLGSYRVLELLGKGGMGSVYRAEHVKLGREVALKLLRGDYSSRRDAVARFFQEARTVNRVRHRNIVDVTDLVELDDGTTYIIMELLTGTSLGTWARGGIDVPRALAVLVQICDGLAAAHQVGVVHRDLKPDNVIVVPVSDGADLVKLLDFGVAKLLNHDDEDVGFQTAAGSVIGTPAYMSPEQAGGMLVDARSDIYSLGAIMYELFCGQPMFRGRSFGEYVRKHLTEMPVVPRQTAGGAQIDPQIEAVILRCLEKDPEHRFATVLELREALLHILGGMDTRRQPPAIPAYAPPPTIARHSYPPPEPPPAAAPVAPTASPRRAWLVGALVATGIGVAAAVWLSSREEPSAPAAAAIAPAAPTPEPPVVPAVPQRPPLVEVRLDSAPSGGVFGAGTAGELCRTPCTLDIDLADGGPTDRREFVVKRDGYSDGVIAVDLASEQHEFRVVLQAAPRPVPDRRPTRHAKPPRRTEPEPTKPPAPTTGSTTGSSIDPAATLDPFHPKK